MSCSRGRTGVQSSCSAGKSRGHVEAFELLPVRLCGWTLVVAAASQGLLLFWGIYLQCGLETHKPSSTPPFCVGRRLWACP